MSHRLIISLAFVFADTEHGGLFPGRRIAPGLVHRRLPEQEKAGTPAARKDRQAAGGSPEGPPYFSSELRHTHPHTATASGTHLPFALPRLHQWFPHTPPQSTPAHSSTSPVRPPAVPAGAVPNARAKLPQPHVPAVPTSTPTTAHSRLAAKDWLYDAVMWRMCLSSSNPVFQKYIQKHTSGSTLIEYIMYYSWGGGRVVVF